MGKIVYLTLGILISAGILFFVFANSKTSGFTALKDFEGEVTFYRSLSCGCCSLHEGYLRNKGGLKVNAVQMPDISSIKKNLGVPQELESCHTAVIGGYFVEGHIPLEAINKLIKEKPDIKGIAMPGMPSGSPGMPGAKSGDFVIYSINKNGSYTEFMRL